MPTFTDHPVMEFLDLLRIGLRWLHALAAVTWIGGGLFFWLVLRPALSEVADAAVRGPLTARIAKEFQGLVQLAVGVLVATGAIMSVDRLSQSDVVSLAYVGVLAIKVTLALVMFWLALSLARPRRRAQPQAAGRVSSQTLVLTLGLAVYLLAGALKVLFESGLKGAGS